MRGADLLHRFYSDHRFHCDNRSEFLNRTVTGYGAIAGEFSEVLQREAYVAHDVAEA